MKTSKSSSSEKSSSIGHNMLKCFRFGKTSSGLSKSYKYAVNVGPSAFSSRVMQISVIVAGEQAVENASKLDS